MAKKKWKLIPYDDREQWLAYRQNGIGGSEIGALLGIYKWSTPLDLYLEKIGENKAFVGNRFTRMGKYMENVIAYLYKYYPKDGDFEQCLLAEESKTLQREVRVYPYIIVNESIPWLFGNIDRQVIKDDRGRGFLETKNTTSMEARQYVKQVNPSFFGQVHQYMFLGEFDFCDAAIFKDGNDLDILPIEPDDRWVEWIVQESFIFWEKVKKAREIKKKYGIVSYYGQHIDFIKPEHHGAIYELQSLEPEITDTKADNELIRELIVPRDEKLEMIGTDEQLQLAHEYNANNRGLAQINDRKAGIQARIIASLGGYHKANFESGGYISYAPNVKGVYSMRVEGVVTPEDFVPPVKPMINL